MQKMSMIVKNIKFSYPKKEVLKGIDFSIQEGDCLAVLGTNGAGKSTLLKCLNKILKPADGMVYIQGKDAHQLKGKELAKNIAYVPQNHTCPRQTVFDTVLIGRKPYISWDSSEKDLKKVSDILDLMDLSDYAMRYTDELSGGEQQKVAIARALAQEPKILLMDEPTSNLDLKNQMEVLRTVKEIVQKEKLSAIVTMHDLNLALRFANKFILLKKGEVYDFGDASILTPEAIESIYGMEVILENYAGIPVVIPL